MMLSNHDKYHIPARGFSTPPASWKSPHYPTVVMPMSERKSTCRRDLFHAVHKVPSGDSPYVRAKHVQLIDKDPNRAISLFWAAINAGDRVDSALKDMAVVMKQLDRSDEAIEAIKSFRHLCTYDSQESLDNVLVELYKRSGRIEEEIDMLHRKLKNIEEGVAFGGKKTKTARSQGKKVQITVEQERSRILGNLAWAYLQHHDYGLAEQYYRKALFLEPDYNKQCNLAICLMHMNRIPEAKSLLQGVSGSCGTKEMDESYAKSFERAVEILNDIESRSLSKPVEEDKENQRSLASPANRWENGENKNKPVTSDKYNNYSENLFEHNKRGSSQSSQHFGVDNDWRKRGHYFESPGERKVLSSPAAVLYTQPRRDSSRFSGGAQRKVRWEDDTIERPSENLLANTIRNLNGELKESTDYKSEAAGSKSQSSLVSQAARNWRGRPQVTEAKSTGVGTLNSFSQPRNEGHMLRYDQNLLVDKPRASEASISKGVNVSDKVKSVDSVEDNCVGKNSSSKSDSKSWADMAEEEDDLSPYFDSWYYDEERNDENLDSNVVHPKSPIETIGQKLEAFDLKDGSPRNPTVRRSLCFDAKKDSVMRKKNRLQVFRDITPTPDSP